MRKVFIIAILTAALLIELGCTRGELPYPYFPDNDIDWEANGFTVMHTTAYCVGHHTATGTAVRCDVAACNTHIGEMAIIYSMDGTYLGIYEVCDKGSAPGLVNGTAIDVYRRNLTQCISWMKLSAKHGNRVYVKFVKGDG